MLSLETERRLSKLFVAIADREQQVLKQLFMPSRLKNTDSSFVKRQTSSPSPPSAESTDSALALSQPATYTNSFATTESSQPTTTLTSSSGNTTRTTMDAFLSQSSRASRSQQLALPSPRLHFPAQASWSPTTSASLILPRRPLHVYLRPRSSSTATSRLLRRTLVCVMISVCSTLTEQSTDLPLVASVERMSEIFADVMATSSTSSTLTPSSAVWILTQTKESATSNFPKLYSQPVPPLTSLQRLHHL